MYKLNLNNMSKGLSFVVLVFAISAFTIDTSAKNEMIPIEKLVCYGQGSNYQLSPSGNFIATMVSTKENVCEIKDDTMQEEMASGRVLVVTDLRTMEPKVLSGTSAGSAVSSFSWLNDEQLLVTTDARRGYDGYSLYTINKDGSNTTRLIQAKDFKSKAGIQVPFLVGIYQKFPNKILISINRQSVVYKNRDLYWLDLTTKKTSLVARVPSLPANETFAGWELDWNGVPKGFSTYDEKGPDMGLVNSFYLFDSKNDSYEKIASCRHQEACFMPLGFDIDNKTILGVGQAVLPDGSILDETDTNAMWAWDSETREYTEMIYHDPDFDISSPMHGDNTVSLWFESDGSDLYGFSYQAAKTEKVYFNNYFASVEKSLAGAFPGYEISIADWSKDLTKFVVYAGNEKDPGGVYFFDVSKGSLSEITQYAPWLKDYNLASTEPFTYTARDGLKLHGYLTLPVDYKKGDKIPFILHPHGGPNARDKFGYNPEVQFYASRGYGVIQPNYRGSTGFGRSEMILANHEMGKTMQTDKYDALFWARDKGYVDMDKVCLSGASYGGYAAMHAATKMPGMFNCIVTYVGTFDLVSKDLRGLRWSEVGMPMEYIEKGNPDIAEDYENLYDNSPIFFVENVTEPVLIITGRRDNQVRFQETVDMVNEFQKHGVDYEYIIKGDEGHGFRSETARLELFKDYEKFLSKHLN